MENIPQFRPRQALQSGDLTNFGQYARDSVDHIVYDGLVRGQAYTGFVISKTAATQVTMTVGRYYNNGAVYPININTTIDLYAARPMAQKKWVAIVAWGIDGPINPQPRMFLIDPVARTTEPQTVTMQDARQGQLGSVAGSEGAQPTYPPVDASVCVVGYVLLDTSGVNTIVQNTATQLPNATDIEAQVTALDIWQSQVGAQINALATALANLQAALGGLASEAEMQAVLSQINLIWDRLNKPASYIHYDTNYFLDTSGSDINNGAFTAQICDGLTFKHVGSAVVNISLLNDLDSNCKVHDNYCLPAFDHYARIICQGYSSELLFNALTYRSNVPCTLLHPKRMRHRYGPVFLPCTSSDWWKRGDLDPVYSNLAFDSESFVSLPISTYIETVDQTDPQCIVGQYNGARRTSFWKDDYDAPYWNRTTEPANCSGQQASQVFLWAQDGWCTQLGHFFTVADTAGDVDIKICHVRNDGAPDLDNVICTAVLPYALIQVSTVTATDVNQPNIVPGQQTIPGWTATWAVTETLFPIPPCFLRGGMRYAVVYTTAGAHRLACSNTDDYVVQGGHWYVDSNANWVCDTTRVIRITIYAAKFRKTRYEIQLQPLQLAGGIAAIDILSEAHVPDACNLTYEVQVGNRWYPLDVEGKGPDLSSHPGILNFRMVFTGTLDLHCGHGLGDLRTKVKLTGPIGSSFVYLSTAKTLGSSTTSLKVVSILEGFDSGNHTYATKIKSGSSTYTPDSVSTAVTDSVRADGSLQRTHTFTQSCSTSFVVEADGGTSGPSTLFKVSEMDLFAV